MTVDDYCSCVYVPCDYDEARMFHRKIVKANKTHECCECHEDIKPGERYELVRGLWEDSWETYKTCLPCKRIRDDMFCEGFYYTMMWEHIIEHYTEVYWDGEAHHDFSFMLPPKFHPAGIP
jgi:hypothetical protein